MIERFFRSIARYSDIALAIGVIAILGVMIVPIPPFVLDILLSFNITLALVVLLTTVYVTQPLELSVFPGLLLVTTLFRLALNVASTRLVLGEAYAGEVISSFGTFVVKGNYVLGFVIFLILIIIQFVVITKGSGRIAEVAARFTLDAMPGKQMSIDADLNAGMITEDVARKRRETIAREADFYGAMDGASKFIRGDAVAGLLIAAINILGGFAIGVLQKGMDITGALKVYTILTIGDGLVAQIPALLLSTSAGIIVTRAAAETNLGEDLTRQLTSHPRAIMIAAGMLLVFGLVPGLPTVPFLLLAVLAGSVGLFADRARKARVESAKAAVRKTEEKKPEEHVEDYLAMDRMEIEIGYGLIPIVDVSQGGDLLERVTMIRKQMALDMGIIVPPIRIRDNIQLRPNEYQIKLKGSPIATGSLQAAGYLAMNPGYIEQDIEGTPTTEPAFGLPAKWISEAAKDRAEGLGYTVVEPAAVLATHLTEIIKAHAFEILNRQDVQRLVDNIKKDNAPLVDELIPAMISIGGVQKILQRLLKERIPVRDLTTILESIAEHVPTTKDPDLLTEYVRTSLARGISQLFKAETNELPVIILDPKLEAAVADGTQTTAIGIRVALPPRMVRRVFANLTELIDQMTSAGQHPIVLTSPAIRFAFRKLVEGSFPSLTVLSYNEIIPGIEVYTVGTLSSEEVTESEMVTA